MASSLVLLAGLLLVIPALAQLEKPPVGDAYSLVPDPYLTAPSYRPPYQAPDVPLTYEFKGFNSSLPEQFLITPASRDLKQVTISWVVPKFPKGSLRSFLFYGTSPTKLNKQSACLASRYSYSYGSNGEYVSGAIYHCRTGYLTPNTEYYYTVFGAPKGFVYKFKSLPRPKPGSIKIGLVADVGQTFNSSTTYQHLMESGAQFTVFCADLTYADNYGNDPCNVFDGTSATDNDNVCGIGGVKWDTWGRLIAPVFGQMPVSFIPGNHELELSPQWGEVTPRKAYFQRVAGIVDDYTYPAYVDTSKLPNGGYHSHAPEYYSLDVGPAHIIYFSHYSAFTKYTAQYNWLMDDLCSIDRSVTPWVLFASHTPWYNSDKSHYREGESARVTFEDWLYNATVDLAVFGHVHAYERSYPVYAMEVDTCGIVHITAGDGGNIEGIAGPFLIPKPAYSAYREESFGYALLDIINSTTAIYTWHRNQNESMVVGDQYVLHNKYVACGSKKPSFC